MKGLYTTAIADVEKEEELIRQALSKIYEIRTIRNERRIMVNFLLIPCTTPLNYLIFGQAKQAGSKETIRRGALMKMLQTTAQTLPLWISKPGQQIPPLVGAIPADTSYVAKVNIYIFYKVKVFILTTTTLHYRCTSAVRRHGGSVSSKYRWR